MQKIKVIILLLLSQFLLTAQSFSQSEVSQKTYNWEEYFIDLYEGSDEGASAIEEAYEYLLFLEQEPLDINTAETNDLLLIPGIDINQISDIIEYRTRNGDMRSIEELALIPSIDYRLRRYLCNFLCVKDKHPATWYSSVGLKYNLSHLKHHITLTAGIPAYSRAGDRNAPDVRPDGETNRYAGKYLGDPMKHSLRYTMNMSDHVIINLTGGKYPGERFFNGGSKSGYDKYAYNITINNLGVIRRLILGTFRAQFGMGLTVNNNMSFGKQTALTSIGKANNVFTAHNSPSDMRHYQGLAMTLNLGKVELSGFFSYRYHDATLNADSTIATILTSPYHRTSKEIEKENNISHITGGGHIRFSQRMDNGLRLSLGGSVVGSRFSTRLDPVFSLADTISRSKMYRYYYPAGRTFLNAGIDYTLSYNDITFSGETAIDHKAQLATVNALTWRFAPQWTALALQRFYDYRFMSVNGSSFGDNKRVQNESGLLVSVQYRPTRQLLIEGFTDIAYHPWLQYLVSSSAYNWESSLSATYNEGLWTFAGRYRAKTRQRDNRGGGNNVLLWKTDHNVRLTATYDNETWSSRSVIEGSMVSFDSSSKGIVASETGTYHFAKRFSLSAMLAYFNTDDYDSRLYVYERGMRYGMGYTAFYGHGMRAYLQGKATISPAISAIFKVGHTQYFDRSYIGTAEAQIFSKHKTDIDLQLNVKL